MRPILVCLALLLPLALSAQQPDQPTGPIAVADSTADDEAIAARIRDILTELDGYAKVSVSVRSGIVTLHGTTPDGASAKRLNDLAGRVEGVVAIENEVSGTTDVTERLNPVLGRFQLRLKQAVAALPLFLLAVTVFAVIALAGNLLARMRRPWDHLAPNAFIADIYRQIVRLAFGIGALVVALDILGAVALLSTILGAAGIAGLAIGFAVRDTVENFIASILLSVRQPFRPNDTVEIEGDTGKVIRLTSRATILLSFDGNHIRIPNATVFKARIVNFTRNDTRRFVFDLSVAPDSDLTAVRQVARDTLSTLPFVLDTPAPEMWIDHVGDSTVSIRMAGWVNQDETAIHQARSEAIRLMILAFKDAGIAMPEPGLRLIGPEQPPSQAQAPETETRTDAEDVSARSDSALEHIVDHERRTLAVEDLLDPQAPDE